VLGIPNPRPYGAGWLGDSQQTLVAGVPEVIIFDDGFGAPTNYPVSMWSAANPTRLTAPEDGIYLITSSVRVDDTGGFFSTSSGTQRAYQGIWKNGVGASLVAARSNGLKQPAIVNQNGNFSLTSIFRLLAGDYLELEVMLHTMVDALTGPALNRASLQMRWMGV
jgi:hypothetical protein